MENIKQIPLGENIKRLRAWHNLSRYDLSKRTGIPIKTIEQLEEHPPAVYLKNLIRIAEVFDVKIESLIKDHA